MGQDFNSVDSLEPSFDALGEDNGLGGERVHAVHHAIMQGDQALEVRADLI